MLAIDEGRAACLPLLRHCTTALRTACRTAVLPYRLQAKPKNLTDEVWIEMINDTIIKVGAGWQDQPSS